MKKVILNAVVVMLAVFTMTSCDKEQNIQPGDLPSAASTFLSTYFSDLSISHAKKEKDGLFGREYTVYLEDGTEIDFDKNGNWIDVDGAGNNPIPTGFILESIVAYVAEKYPSADITAIERNRTGFEVELTNGMDLEFDKNGNFTRVD